MIYLRARLSSILASTSVATSFAFIKAPPAPFSGCIAGAGCTPSHPRSVACRESSSSSADRLTLEKVVESLKEGQYKKVLVVAGAGVSVSAGIPDVSGRCCAMLVDMI